MIFSRVYRTVILPRYRLLVVLRAFLVVFLSSVFLRLAKRFMATESFLRHAARTNEKNAQRLFKTILRLKGLFIKAGQYLSLRVDVLPDEYIRVLSALQDRVPPVPFAGIQRRVERELGKPLIELFAEIEEEPVASASLAQVHKAKLHDGRMAAVKVLYPGIENLFLADLNIVLFIVSLIRFFNRKFNYAALFHEFKKHAAFEIDMLNEARNAKILMEKFKDSPRIVIPRVVDSHTSQGVLTTEFIAGVKITEKEAYVKNGIDVFDVSRETVDAYMRQIFKYGFFQADPHPGNLFVILDKSGGRRQETGNSGGMSMDIQPGTPNFSIGIVDFGLCKELPPEFVGGMVSAATAIIQRDAKMLAGAMVSLGFQPSNGREESLYKFCGFVMFHVEDFIYKRKGDINFASIIQEILEMAREHPLVHVPADFIFIGRVFALLIGLGKNLGAKIDVASIVLPYVRNAEPLL